MNGFFVWTAKTLIRLRDALADQIFHSEGTVSHLGALLRRMYTLSGATILTNHWCLLSEMGSILKGTNLYQREVNSILLK